MSAISQAQTEGLYVYSKKQDPNFHYGEAYEMTIKELRANIDEYNGAKVAFEGVIVKDHANMIYVEEYDAENDMYFGMAVYYGAGNLPGKALGFLSVGNRVRIVGTVTQFEGMWQVSGLTYSLMQPDNPDNLGLISEGHLPAYVPTTPEAFKNGKVSVTIGDQTREYDYVNLALYTSIEMRDLKVKSIYTTESGDNKGAMTLTCESPEGLEISVRTIVLRDSDGNLITAEYFGGATIDVKGLVDHYTYNGANDYQIKVFSVKDIIVH
jgi:hypothetical protein